MHLQIEAIFDGETFVPTVLPALAPNTRVQLHIETETEQAMSFLETARSLKLDGPPDWSLALDEYLYGERTANGA